MLARCDGGSTGRPLLGDGRVTGAPDQVVALAGSGWARLALTSKDPDAQNRIESGERAQVLLRPLASSGDDRLRDSCGRSLAVALRVTAQVRSAIGEADRAERDAREALEVARTGLVRHPGDERSMPNVASAAWVLAGLLTDDDPTDGEHADEAFELHCECLELRRALATADPTVARRHLLFRSLQVCRHLSLGRNESAHAFNLEIVEVVGGLDQLGEANRNELAQAALSYRYLAVDARRNQPGDRNAAVDLAMSGSEMAAKVLDQAEVSEETTRILLGCWVELLEALSAARERKRKAEVAKDLESRVSTAMQKFPGREITLLLADVLAWRVEAAVQVGQPSSACELADSNGVPSPRWHSAEPFCSEQAAPKELRRSIDCWRNSANNGDTDDQTFRPATSFMSDCGSQRWEKAHGQNWLA